MPVNATCWWSFQQVIALQKRLSIPQTGVLNKPTWDALNDVLKITMADNPPPEPDYKASFWVKEHYLYQHTQRVGYKATPNLSSGVINPTLIVIHYTGDNSLQGALSWLTTRNSGVSCHLVISKTGTVWQLAPFNRRAWHAGASNWNGRSDCNNFSIGIENVGVGDEWPEMQVQANIDVIKALAIAYEIEALAGHNEIAPGRKVDPGPRYPWDQVREATGF